VTIEPIRPVGLRDGGDAIDRSGGIERVVRRRPRTHDEESRDRRDEDHDTARLWSEQQGVPVGDPGTYDDHGRMHDDEDVPPHPHVDATA